LVGVVRSRGAGAFAALAFLSAAVVGLRFVVVEGTPSQVVYLAAVGLSAVMAWVGIRRWRPENPRPWRWLAVGVTFSALADHVYFAYDWLLGRPEPVVSFADPLWFFGFAAVGMAILGFGQVGSLETETDAAIDAVQLAVVGLLLTWEFSISPSLGSSGLILHEQLMSAAYPVIDVALLALVVRLLVARRIRSTAGILVVLGLSLWLAADAVYLPIIQSDRYRGGVVVWLDALWMAGPLAMGLAAMHPRMAQLSQRRPAVPDDHRLGSRRLMASVGWLIVPGLVMAVSHRAGEEPSLGPSMAATVVLGGLLMVRSMRLLRAHDRVRAELLRRERYFEALAANASDATLVLDRRGRVTNESVALVGLLGLQGGTTGIEALDLIDARDVERASTAFGQALANPSRVAGLEMRSRHTDGAVRWMSARIVNLLDDPAVGGVVVNLQDVSAGKEAERELTHQAFHDPLTGLANRALFRDRVERAMRHDTRSRHDLAVVYLDLDGFKTVNDGLGHDRGDDLLRLVAARLTHTVREQQTLARLGGDEFAVLVEDDAAIDEASALAERILRVFDDPFALGGAVVAMGASIGIAEGGLDTSADDLLRNADVAMYRAKASGKGCAVLFDAEMRVAAEDRLRLETDLAGALDRGEIILRYQPVIDLDTGDLTGFEALARWNHPALGLLMPDRFINIAEETGLIVPIGAWVLAEACRAAAGWHARFPQDVGFTMAVNLSGRQLAAPELVSHVTAALAGSGLAAHLLVLEVTETVLVVDPTTAALVLGELRDLGLRLAIDDFGTGYSSLSYLRQFPIDVLKIDQSFIATMSPDNEIPAIVRALIELGHTLGMEIVAEGIETNSQLAQLRELRCERGQGYLFAKPLTPERAEALVQGRSVDLRPAAVTREVTW
jgi:diguanylate cyclase (GGDEF)-like protein/PAS domain S-box-containing protein